MANMPPALDERIKRIAAELDEICRQFRWSRARSDRLARRWLNWFPPDWNDPPHTIMRRREYCKRFGLPIPEQTIPIWEFRNCYQCGRDLLISEFYGSTRACKTCRSDLNRLQHARKKANTIPR